MIRHETRFPIKVDTELCKFLYKAWTAGWLDEYSNDHFLIKAIEGRIESFVGIEQLKENGINICGVVHENGFVDLKTFCFNFCINFSMKMSFWENHFGEANVKRFVMDQLSAGKKAYNEDTFFQALSEVSVLSFFASRCKWDEILYEPPVNSESKKNPEARFARSFQENGENEGAETLTVNIEVKSPGFPHTIHPEEKIMVPTVLLTEEGRKIIPKFCEQHQILYLEPKLLKLRDYINSACEKFSFPQKGEYNFLYINWSFRDFPSNSFLEAWSLLTNEVNGIITHPSIASSVGINPDAFTKITAIVVYTESLEGLMFSNFAHVWERRGCGPRFRMWVVDEKLRKDEMEDVSDILFKITGMNPDKSLTQYAMFDGKSRSDLEYIENCKLGTDLCSLVTQYTLRAGSDI